MKINNLIANFGKLIFALSLLLAVQVSFAQDELNWVGDVSTDAYDPSNWSPAESITGKVLKVDSAYKLTNLPIIGVGTGHDTITSLDIRATSKLTVDKGAEDTLIVTSEVWSGMVSGTVEFLSGVTIFKKNVYIKDSLSVWDVKGDDTELKFGALLFWSSSSGYAYGGKLYVSEGATVSTNSWGPSRMGGEGETASLIVVSDSATLTIPADVVDYMYTLVDDGYLQAGEGEEIIVTYDVTSKITTVGARSNTVFRVDPEGSSQNIFEEEEGSVLRVHDNVGKSNKTAFQWKYTTTSGSGYIDIVGATADTLVPAFANEGLYYVVCVGTLDGGGEEISNEIVINVVPEVVIIDPLSDQFLREGQSNAPIIATYDGGTPTAKEWLITETSGSGYVSFETPVTSDTLEVEFATAGEFYVICKATIDGSDYMSKEIPIKVAASDDASYDISWVGAVDNDALNPYNWSPVAHMNGNSIIKIDTTTDYDSVVLAGPAGNISVNNFELTDSASFTFDLAAEDSVILSGGSSSYISGNIIINDGYVKWRKGNLYLEKPISVIDIKGGMFDVTAAILFGRKDGTSGGYINISGDGVFRNIYKWSIGRWSNDSTMSVMHITDNGKYITSSDYRSELTSRIGSKQLITDEDRELVIFYDEATDITTVTSIAATDFKATPYDYDMPNYVGVYSDALTLTAENTDGITNLEWKYGMYADSIDMSFSTAQTSATCNPEFDASGLYYVACFGEKDGSPVMTNIIKVQAVSVAVSPTEVQAIEALTSGTQLLVTESMVSDSKEWKFSTTSGSGYQSMTPTAATGDDYTPIFADGGEYYIICESMYAGTSIISNEVLVKVVDIYFEDDSKQTIKQNENGSTITVVESVTVDSREWMYSTTSGSGYTSFATAETGETYVPNFADVGTYYVICEVTVGDVVLETEEVEIEVETGTGISIAKVSELKIYPNPSNGTFSVNPGNLTNYRLQIFDITGKVVFESENNNGIKEISLDRRGMYVVKVLDGDNLKISRLSIK
jgi:hypothetical protein